MKKLVILFFGFLYLFANSYILNSEVNIKRYKNLGLDIWTYQEHLQLLKKLINKKGYQAKIISPKELNILKNNDILFVIDAFSLSKSTQNKIINFVANGGRLVFNFKTAFLDENGNLTQKNFLEKITKLKTIGYGYKPKTYNLFLVQNLLSPISIPDAKVIDFVVYDTIPFFKGKKADLEFTTYAATSYLKYNKKPIPSGAIWSGKYKKGGWIYFSFPFYVMTENMGKYVFDSILDYVLKGIKIVKYPYLKYQKMVFISEDTEYKYKNFNNFINALYKYDLNGTAFCVGRLAKNYPEFMKEVGNLPFLEIASHSYSHTKLIDKTKKELDEIEINGNNRLLSKLSLQEIKGFRPPREEINKKMIEVIKKGSIKYILGSYLEQLRPKYLSDLMVIPRIGTDDYQYLMELDWNKTQIIENMKKEVDYVTHLSGLFTLSTHTHLMCYKSNIQILEGFLEYVKKRKYPTLKGKDIVNLIYTKDNIDIYIKNNQIEIFNKNQKIVKEFVFRIYFLTKIPNKIRCALKTKIIKKDNYMDIKIFNLKPNKVIKVMLLNG